MTDYSVGILELKSIARGYQAADDALKTAGVTLVSAQAICPGKFQLVAAGELAQVAAVMEKLRSAYADTLIDSVHLGRIDPSVIQAMLGGQPEGERGALGIVETFSAASAVLAADQAVKSANVCLVDLRIARGIGGKGVVILTGAVADVTAAVEAGSRYAKEQGLFAGESVVAAPHRELWEHI